MLALEKALICNEKLNETWGSARNYELMLDILMECEENPNLD